MVSKTKITKTWTILFVVFFFLTLIFFQKGDVDSFVIWQIRFPEFANAVCNGALLSMIGVLTQTYFQNDLADPYILGVSSGSGLGIALWLMFFPFLSRIFHLNSFFTGSLVFSFLGALLVLGALFYLGKKVGGKYIFLIFGILITYLVSSIISILQFIGDTKYLKGLVLWGAGNFSRPLEMDLLYLFIFVIIMITYVFSNHKKWDVLYLGDNYASTLGINIEKEKLKLIFIIGLSVAVTTSFAGPIVFIGLVAPHISRMIFKTNRHFILLPSAVMIGMIMILLAISLTKISSSISLPTNSVIGILSFPIIAMIILKRVLKV